MRWVHGSRARACVAYLTVVALVLTTGAVAMRYVDPAAPFRPKRAKSVAAVRTEKVASGKAPRDSAKPASGRPKAAWPGGGTKIVNVVGDARALASGQPPAATTVGGLPVVVTAAEPFDATGSAGASNGSPGDAGASGSNGSAGSVPAKVQVQVLDRAATDRAKTTGVLLRVARADGTNEPGKIRLGVDYQAFATAYGGDWANRLRLVALPECALKTPQAPACAGTVLATSNDARHAMVSSEVAVGRTAAGGSTTGASRGADDGLHIVDAVADGATVVDAVAGGSGTLVAVQAGASGSTGSFAATTLASSSNWSAGGMSGDFSWSYPMRVPAAQGGPAPTVSLSYSAQSVDGRMAASNNQPSMVGEGFELASGGYIERRYKSCGDDTAGSNTSAKTGDQCWATDNAVLSLNGSSSELIRDASNPNLWHPRKDDGSRVERRTGAPNGDNDGEWWVVTAGSGTQYWFGRNHLPGWSDGRASTNSTWTEPVFGNHDGEPCHASTFAASSCTQAWRWNLDYVVDPHDNTMSLWYSTDTGHYAKNEAENSPAAFTRDGRLDRVEYGTRVEGGPASGTDTVFSGHASARVDYAYADRCLSNCGTHDARSWPDTPWDLDCGATSCGQSSPTFFSTRRLASITTRVFDAGGGSYRDVERWTLTHSFPDPEDSTRAGLWLERISHTGLANGDETKTPDVTFTGVAMNNRVDTVDFAPAMNWRRISTIATETGGLITVVYSPKDCVAGSRVPSAPENNTLRCYPVKWTPPGYTQKLDYFHKYVVTDVIESDLTGGATRVLHHYDYQGDPAWHYTDDDGLSSNETRTWSQWRGYAVVATTEGDPGEQTYSENRYLRGMHGDHLPSGSRSVTVTDSRGGQILDEDVFSGMVRETRVFDGPGGALVSGSITDPWQSAPTASRTINGVTVSSRYINTQGTRSWVVLDHDRGIQEIANRSTFDSFGMAVTTEDLGNTAVAGDEQCTVTSYEPRNTSAWLMTFPQRAQTYATSCDRVASGAYTATEVIGDARTSYDGGDWASAPVRGDVTRVEQLSSYSGGAPQFVTVSRSAYDAQGRVVESWDVLGNRSATAYTPAVGGPVTQTVDTNQRGWTTTTVLDPALGQPVKNIDVNGLVTEMTYDGLGRLTAGWSPGRTKGKDPANRTFEYLIRTDGAVAVTTRSLNASGGYVTSYQLYDGLLRERQTQATSPAGGRLLSDIFYDSVGRAKLSYDTYYDKGAPGTDLVKPTDNANIPKQTRVVYDGTGRPLESIFQPYGRERWRTSTRYGGDRTDVTPPPGGTATSTLADARGAIVELRQYRGANPTPFAAGSYDSTSYVHDGRGLLTKVTNPAGESWSYGYDLRGRKTSASDPDAGNSTMDYDDAGRLVSSTDGRGIKLAYQYDNLDRKIGLWRDAIGGTRLASWSYDTAKLPDGTTPALGQLSSSARYVGSSAYTTTSRGYGWSYQSTGVTVTIPTTEQGLAGSYTFDSTYNPDDTVNTFTYPQTANLKAESAKVDYTGLGLPSKLTSFYGANYHTSYVSDTEYDALAQPTKYTFYQGLFSDTGSRVYEGYERELETGRLARTTIQRDGANPNTLADIAYSYDSAGKITKIADTPAGGASDTQCFGYDYLARLTSAWTPGDGNCTATPSTGALGGPAPYWQEWTYDLAGRRLTQTARAAGGIQTTTGYAYPTGANQPHTLSSTTTTTSTPATGSASAATQTVTMGYGYDAAGNTIRRPGAAGDQTLAWDDEGRVKSTSDASGTTSYLYDADGNRIIRRDATGKTLYLPNEEVRYTTETREVTCTRYYEFGGGVVAQRAGDGDSGVTWLVGDHHGTQQISITAVGQDMTRRRETPFGTPRGTAVTWPNEKGFVGGTNDPTGLTHLGAREYDPGIGRFVSVDPVLDTADPQQMNGYSYANNSPISSSDPSGTVPTFDWATGVLTLPGVGAVVAGLVAGSISDTNAGGSTAGVGDEGGTGGKSHQTSVKKSTAKSGGSKSSGGGSGKKAKPKACGAWDLICKGKQAAVSAWNWAGEHKAQIAGVVASVVVGVGCEAALAWTGVGAVACGAVAGAVGSMVTYAVQRKLDGKSINGKDMLIEGLIGGVIGGVTGGLFSIGTQGVKAGVSAAISGQGAKAALSAAGGAARQEARAIASGLTRGAISKGASKSVGEATESALCNSFTPGSAVLLADGTPKPIDLITVGDLVLATDPTTGSTGPQPVTATISTVGQKHLVEITVETDGSEGQHIGTVTATDEHPFWVADLNRWVPATGLQVGQWLRTSTGAWVRVTQLRRWTAEDQHVHNLTVADTHTYYVVVGDSPVLVHNACKAWTELGKSKQQIFKDEVAEIGAGNGTPRIDESTGLQKVYRQPNPKHDYHKFDGALEYSVPKIPDRFPKAARIIVKTFSNGAQLIGWTVDHYVHIWRY